MFTLLFDEYDYPKYGVEGAVQKWNDGFDEYPYKEFGPIDFRAKYRGSKGSTKISGSIYLFLWVNAEKRINTMDDNYYANSDFKITANDEDVWREQWNKYEYITLNENIINKADNKQYKIKFINKTIF